MGVVRIKCDFPGKILYLSKAQYKGADDLHFRVIRWGPPLMLNANGCYTDLNGMNCGIELNTRKTMHSLLNLETTDHGGQT